MSTNAEKPVETGVVVAKISSGNADFCNLVQKRAVVTLIISGVTGLILIIFAHDVATVLPLNIFNHNCHIPNHSGMPACKMKVILPILPKIGCHGNVLWQHPLRN